MFTLDQIEIIHERLGKQETLPQFLLALKALGIYKYDSFVDDGHSEYFGKGNEKVVSPATHDNFDIASESSRERLERHLELHSKGESDYFEMSLGVADSGIEKWTFDIARMTMTYYDKAGKAVLVESIK